MIAKGVITQRANEERLPAQTIERDYPTSAPISAPSAPDFGGVETSKCSSTSL